jgi:hypothetical protein
MRGNVFENSNSACGLMYSVSLYREVSVSDAAMRAFSSWISWSRLAINASLSLRRAVVRFRSLLAILAVVGLLSFSAASKSLCKSRRVVDMIKELNVCAYMKWFKV